MHPPFSLYRMYLKRKYDVFDKKSDEYTIIEKEGIIKTALDSTISVFYGIPAYIYDSWDGSYFAPMNWKIQSGKEHEWTWLSSLDYRSDLEVACITENGHIDQAGSFAFELPVSIVVQRPALRTSAIHDDTHESVYIAEEKKISYADQLIVEMFFYLHLFDE